MRAFLIHQNYPGQFHHLGPALQARGHQVLAMGDVLRKRPVNVPAVYYKTPEEGRETTVSSRYAMASERGLAAMRAAAALRDRHDYHPDVILGHHGWGETLFLREVWPRARLLVYGEFCYRTEGFDVGFDPEFAALDLDRRARVVARGAHLVHSAAIADAVVVPTRFQASSFPPALQPRITVQHDGIDTARLCPDPNARFTLPNGRTLRPGDEVLSFVSRQLEPYRGFHSLMRALPAILRARPNAQVVMVGGDQRGYGPVPDGQSWKERLLAELGDRIDLGRVHFTGKIAYPDFVALMQVTRAHVYLTYPFVLSWSMLEAMSAGALVIGSRTAPVEEVIADGRNGRLVDFFDTAALAETVIRSLGDPDADAPLRLAARAHVKAHYALDSALPRLVDFVESAGT
ncbi:MAG: glycosyltransferase [Paracoccaceae bacterium]